MKNSTADTLTTLALATAAYETAWRAEVALPTGADRTPTGDAMRAAFQSQQASLRTLTEALDADTVKAIHGAMIVATVNVHGERPDANGHRDLAEAPEAKQFVGAVRADQAGVSF